MALFVHLTSDKNVKPIIRAGIKGKNGVYCLPVLPNYYISHQWLRELKRGGQRTIVGIYFHLPSYEEVWVGRYNLPHTYTTASEAARLIRDAADAEGYEVIVPRSIGHKELRKVRPVPQVLGWRYMPNAHGRPPRCGCRACLPPGSIKSRAIRERHRLAD